jgi:hypothetical protein
VRSSSAIHLGFTRLRERFVPLEVFPMTERAGGSEEELEVSLLIDGGEEKERGKTYA